jgi:hypothetical protein
MCSLDFPTTKRVGAFVFAGFAWMVCFVFTPACSCSDQKPVVDQDGGHPDGEIVFDADGVDARAIDAAADSGGVGPVETVHFDFCDEPLFKLPMDGHTEQTAYPDMWGHQISYVRHPVGVYEILNPYRFDIDRCTEEQLTAESRASVTSICPELIIWSDGRYYLQGQDDHCGDIHILYFDSFEEVRLTDDKDCEFLEETNGMYLAYTKAVYDPDQSPMPGPSVLKLMDLSDFEVIELAPGEAETAYLDMDETHLVWGAGTAEPDSIGRDIHYRNLQSGETRRVVESGPYWTHQVSVSSGHIVYRASETYQAGSLSLHLYIIDSEEHIVLAENDDAWPRGAVGGNLVAWATDKYGGGLGQPNDIEMYDIRSGRFRRLTTRASELRPHALQFPYLLIYDDLGLDERLQYDYYVANLVKLGVTDDEGNLLEGEAVLEPPR